MKLLYPSSLLIAHLANGVAAAAAGADQSPSLRQANNNLLSSQQKLGQHEDGVMAIHQAALSLHEQHPEEFRFPDRQLQASSSVVNIAGIYDTDSLRWGEDIFEAVISFLNDPNDEWHDDIFDLHGQFEIKYKIANAACDASRAARAYWDVRSEWEGQMSGIVGCRCSGASSMVATFSGLENVAQISMSASSASFTSNAEDFPLFSRTVSPDNEDGQVGAMMETLKAFGWNRVHLVVTDIPFSKDSATAFRNLWEADGGKTFQGGAINLESTRSGNTVVDKDSARQVLQGLPGLDSDQNSRIILLMAHSEHASEILELAHQEDLVQSDTIWVGPEAWAGRFTPPNNPGGSSSGYIGVSPYRNRNAHYQDFMLRFNAYQIRMGRRIWDEFPEYVAEHMIDAILSLVKAIANTPPADRTNGELVTENLRALQFPDGVTGDVSFTEDGDRRDPQFSIVNLQDPANYSWNQIGLVSLPTVGAKSAYINREQVCFPEVDCGTIPEDSTPVPSDDDGLPIWVPIILAAVSVALLAVACKYRFSKAKKTRLQNEMKQMAKQLEQQMQGIVKVVHDLPFQSAEVYNDRLRETASRSDVNGVWYWEEDSNHVGMHETSSILQGTNFVGYVSEISDQIEHAYQVWNEGKGYSIYDVDLTNKVQKKNNAETGLRYKLDFEAFTQQNATSNFKRSIRREEVAATLDANLVQLLPPLPDDIVSSGENILPTLQGQIVQISKVHPEDKAWAYGNVLYDPLLQDAKKNSEDNEQTTSLNSVLIQAIHDRPTSGWFPTTMTEPADLDVMQNLVGTMGEEVAALNPPATWETMEASTVDYMVGRIKLQPSSSEYQEVAQYFSSALYAQQAKVQVVGVERIQNLPLWQTYAVKRQTTMTRHEVGAGDTERRWLFHGTTMDIVPKIEKQGFNRAFAGRNAVVYGKGVYFARDASYSSHSTYSQPDSQGVQRMFMCRVVVGDWCRGQQGQLTPDPKPHDALELFDSTVDNVANPSIFVVYHDAQAYPEYLVSFKSKN